MPALDSAPLTPPEGLTPSLLASVVRWFHQHSKTFPWTETRDPYAIWISEIMLQQTVVTAGIGPYRDWMRRWPDLAALAEAAVEEVLAAWEGLGYASRARNLHKAAQLLRQNGASTLPDDYDALRALPGIGDYTASALLSFAFGKPALTLDANLKRVFQRLGGEPDWTADLEKRWRSRWAELVDGPLSRDANQGFMQLGQLVCTARNPDCTDCPLAAVCAARMTGTTADIPRPVVRTITEVRTRVAVWVRPDGALWLAKPNRGRFSNLWMFPPLAGDAPPGAVELTGRLHTYTRYKDYLTPFTIQLLASQTPSNPADWEGRWVTRSEVQNLGMVSVYRKILQEAMQDKKPDQKREVIGP